MMGGQQIIILKEGTEREKGKGAVFNNIAAARAVADAVKSTLGPKGMDKMLVDSLGDVTITNDGITILKEIEIERPTAKMLVEVAKTQDGEVGDGTTSAVILAGELLKEAESLSEQEVHPTLIVNGYRMAAAEAVKLLRELAFAVKRTDKETLRWIARTAMSGRSVGTNANFLADIAVDAVQAIVEEVASEVRADVDNILVQKKHGGNLTDTTLIDGIVLDKERVHPRMAKFVRDAKIALINRALEVKKTEVNEEIRIRDPAKLQMFLDEEEKTLRTMVEKIKASGANVVLCQKGIDDVAQHFLAKEGIYAVRRVKESDMKKLAIEAFAGALEVIPRALGENAGLDPIDVLIKLRAAHGKKGGKAMGVDVMSGEPLDMLKANVVEPLRVKVQEIDSAAEVASMILRIDDVIASKKSPPPPPGAGEHGHGGMGGMPGMGM